MASLSLPPFLAKLLAITRDCNPELGGWNNDGTEFVVKNDRFDEEVLKKHFKGNKQTFIRQLHFYCFKKLDNKGEEWAFSHPKFQRDSPHLVYEIKRKTRVETSGPASKDEVQALRDETVSMRQDMVTMQEKIDTLTKQVEMLLSLQDVPAPPPRPVVSQNQQRNQHPHYHHLPQQNSHQHFPQEQHKSFVDDSLYHKRAKTLTDPNRESDETSSEGAFSGLLPFEDGSHATYYKDGEDYDIQSPRSLSDSDSGNLKKPSPFEDFDTTMELGDLTDLFLGNSGGVPPFQREQSYAAPPPVPQLYRGPSSSSSSSSSSGSHKAAQSRGWESTATPSRVEAAMPSNEPGVVSLVVNGRESPMPNTVFAGFLAKFVEHAALLHSRNMLEGDLDPELEIFVHASLPNYSPLKDLLSFAPSKVRTVLVNVLSDVQSSYWQVGDDSAPDQNHLQQNPFQTRPLLVFRYETSSKEVRGECFLHFLHFLLRAAIHADSDVPPLNLQSSPFFVTFSKYFSPQVNHVMSIAYYRIEETKKRLAQEPCTPSPKPAEFCVSNSRA